jgi:drug/metabolite transporter (DMT)-like permease
LGIVLAVVVLGGHRVLIWGGTFGVIRDTNGSGVAAGRIHVGVGQCFFIVFVFAIAIVFAIANRKFFLRIIRRTILRLLFIIAFLGGCIYSSGICSLISDGICWGVGDPVGAIGFLFKEN